MSRLARTIVHAVIFLAFTYVMTLLAGTTPRPGIAMLLSLLLGTDHGVSFSISAALALNRQRTLLFVQLFITVLLLWPPHGADLAIACLPIALGLAAGMSITRLINDTTEPAAPPALPPRIVYDHPRPTLSAATDERPTDHSLDRRAPRHPGPRDY
jgi:hypothetical protein